MNTYFCRVDDRLLHGQLTAAWARKLSLTNIFIIDNDLANDKRAIRVMTAMAPQRVSVTVMPVEQAAYMLQQDCPELEDKTVLCLLGDLKSAAELLVQTKGRFSSLNLGGLTSRVGRYEVAKNLFLSNDERRIIRQITEEAGISVFHQVLPSDSPIDVGAFVNSNKAQEK